jgi:uncharacterized protein YndB with AHSA1/START domain
MTAASESSAARQDIAARSFSMSIDINATPDEVWRALTDAAELVRWFPLQARVIPGEGGSMFWGWDGHWAWESRIAGWEPGKRLTLVENRPTFDVKGDPLPGPAQQMAMEFTLETDAGRTRLRLVHSGFGHGANWDDELDSVSAGWQFELRGLRHYLEHHRGRDRYHAAVHAVTPLPTAEVWRRLLSPAAFVVTTGSPAADQPCVIRAATGDQIAGTVRWLKPGWDLLVAVDDLDAGIFRISTWRAGGQTGVQVWMVTYAPEHAARVTGFGERLTPVMERLFK